MGLPEPLTELPASRREHIAGSRGCESTITVVLDAGAREHFSGIRILIVCSWVTCDLDWDLCAIRSSLDVFDDSPDRFTLRNQLLHRKKAGPWKLRLRRSTGHCTTFKELRLVAGHQPGDQILRFVPSVPVSTLKKLHLISISGLTNNDLFSLLSLVSPTLEELHIQSTPTPRAGVDEPYALDATIPNMSRLKSVTLDGDHASALTIARKGPGSRKRQMGQSEIRGTITVIVRTEFEVMHAQSVIRALETAGWKHVMVWVGIGRLLGMRIRLGMMQHLP
ncbi:hypothetical protein E4T56_gene19052 [Termitomyces sp. T112]|nr:hypothetical protein E4T56_gene19052 [Termitomyces sp. T112]